MRQGRTSESMALYSGNNKSPCFNAGKDCERRTVGCRATCKEWKKWEAEHRAQKDKEYQARQRNFVGTARKIRGIKPKER